MGSSAGSAMGGALISSVLALRQLYSSPEEMARWADPNSISEGTIRIFGPLGNPNLLAGISCRSFPWLPWPCCAGADSAAGCSSGHLILGGSATVLTYSRGGWIGLMASMGVLILLLLLRSTRHWPLLWRRLFPLLVLLLGATLLVVAASKLEPIRTRVSSLMAGRGDSSNNFRINVWIASFEMVQDRPWLGIGPGNNAFNRIYPLYQQPKFNALRPIPFRLKSLWKPKSPG